MKLISREDYTTFKDGGFRMDVISDTENAKILNCNIRAGAELPVHSHDIEGELCITILAGEGLFLGANGAELPARAGDMLISEIREPHGLRAVSDLRAIVVITPPHLAGREGSPDSLMRDMR